MLKLKPIDSSNFIVHYSNLLSATDKKSLPLDKVNAKTFKENAKKRYQKALDKVKAYAKPYHDKKSTGYLVVNGRHLDNLKTLLTN